jgi:pyruvate/2-oxoglutarate dehydrogenase complex dihydrolipoamide acyltransferase (E2) component
MQYRIASFPKTRLATVDVGRLGAGKHNMYALLEVDVTRARSDLRKLRLSRHGASFIAWVIKTIADCVSRNPEVHALQFGKTRTVLFDDVDIAVPVEVKSGESSVPLPLLIRGSNRKTMEEIEGEIQGALRQPVVDERDYIRGEHSLGKGALRLYYWLPRPLRVLSLRILTASPFRMKKHSGTVTVTTVNSVGTTSGWIVPTRSWHNLFFGLGSLCKKPWVVAGKVEIREILNMTVCFNHDVIDGMPARRFMQDLTKRMEAGIDPGTG